MAMPRFPNVKDLMRNDSWRTQSRGRKRRLSAFSRLVFLFFFVNGNRIEVLRFENLSAIKATDVIDAIAAVKEFGSLVLTGLHSEITYSSLRRFSVKCYGNSMG